MEQNYISILDMPQSKKLYQGLKDTIIFRDDTMNKNIKETIDKKIGQVIS